MKAFHLFLISLSICLLFSYAFLQKDSTEQKNEKHGKFIELEEGKVHYQLSGVIKSPTIIFIQGPETSLKTWDLIVDKLSQSYQILRYDLFGSGLSTHLHLTSNLKVFRNQLIELLTTLNLKGPFFIVGHSTGAMIAADFGHRYPSLVKKMVFIGPESLKQQEFAQVEKFFSFLSSSSDPMESYKKMGPLKKNTMVLWGEKEAFSASKEKHKFNLLLRGAQFHTVKKSSHVPQYESPAMVNQLLLSFFSN